MRLSKIQSSTSSRHISSRRTVIVMRHQNLQASKSEACQNWTNSNYSKVLGCPPPLHHQTLINGCNRILRCHRITNTRSLCSNPFKNTIVDHPCRINIIFVLLNSNSSYSTHTRIINYLHFRHTKINLPPSSILTPPATYHTTRQHTPR